MSDQIREQVSAFLDGELPSSESELLLKRLTRDADLRASFGRYALIGETLRGANRVPMSRGFATRVNRAIDGEAAAAVPPGIGQGMRATQGRWWRPVAGAAVAASVAVVAVVALQQRAVSPGAHPTSPLTAQSVPAPAKEARSYYIVPASNTGAASPAAGAAGMPAMRLASYVFAHTNYVSGLGQVSQLLADPDDFPPADHGTGDDPAAGGPALHNAVATQQDPHIAP